MHYDFVLLAGLDLHIADESDDAFLEELFDSTHDHFYTMGLPEQYISALIKQQYHLQKTSYRQQWPRAKNFIVRWCGRSIGRIILHEEQGLLHLIDFALVPEQRSKGYGSSILRAVQVYTKRHQMLLKLSVENHNQRAKKLYLSLGFEVVEGTISHEIMTWMPTGLAITDSPVLE